MQNLENRDFALLAGCKVFETGGLYLYPRAGISKSERRDLSRRGSLFLAFSISCPSSGGVLAESLGRGRDLTTAGSEYMPEGADLPARIGHSVSALAIWRQLSCVTDDNGVYRY